MNNTIQYKGYVGSVEFSEADGIFFGKVMGIRSLISYEGESAKELLNDFHDAVDTYLEHCKEEGKKPELAFKGSFNIRLSPALHIKALSLCNRTPDVYQSVYRRHLRGLPRLETRDLNECFAILNRTPI